MGGEIQISVRAYAKQLGVDEKAVRKAIEEGKIKRGYVKSTKKIKPTVANKEWGFLHETPKPQRGVSAAKAAEKADKKGSQKPPTNQLKEQESEDVPEKIDKSYSYSELIDQIKITPNLKYSEALRRKEILNIAKEKMNLEELQGILVRKSEVDKALFIKGDQLKKDLLNMPSRIMDDVLTAPNKVEATNIFLFELNDILKKHSLIPDGSTR